MRTHVAKAVLGVILVGAMAACVDVDSSDDDAATTTTTVAPDDTTTTNPDATTTTTPRGADLGEVPRFHDDGPSGSGCTPGDDVGLPDGWWYGTIATSTDAVDFDLACYHTGASAEAEAASRGDEVNNGYYVVNDNPSLRSLPVASDATASCVELGDELQQADCDPADVTGEWAVWIRVVGGVVDRIVEQYAP